MNILSGLANWLPLSRTPEPEVPALGADPDALAVKLEMNSPRIQRYNTYLAYYNNEVVPEQENEFPLHINYTRKICDLHNSYLWGQWKRDIVNFQVMPLDDSEAGAARAQGIEERLYQVWRDSHHNRILFEAGLNGAILGDSVLKVHWDALAGRTVVENIDPYCFFPRWYSSDQRTLKRVLIAYYIDRADALDEYGIAGNPQWVGNYQNTRALYREIWTPEEKLHYIDDIPLTALSGENPYGFIPFVHIGNVPAGNEFWGSSDIADVLGVHDEINRKLADQGDIINYHAHPIIVAVNPAGDVRLLEVGPDKVWEAKDVGTRKADYHFLEWRGNQPAVKEHMDRLFQVLQDTSGIPDVAYGRFKGTQQSGLALQIEMLPVTQRAIWKRLLWDDGLRRVNRLILELEGRYGGLDVRGVVEGGREVRAYEGIPVWAPILPRDRSALVNENVNLVVNRLRSLVEALEDLGEENPKEERERIFEDLKELAGLGQSFQQNGAGLGSSLAASQEQNDSNA
jgi:hypothetical protein